MNENELADLQLKQKLLEDALERVARDRAEVAALLESIRAVCSSRDLKQGAAAILASCKRFIGAEMGYIALRSDKAAGHDIMVLESGETKASQIPGRTSTCGLAAEVYDTGQPVYDNDFASSRWAKGLPDDHIQLSNVLCVPLVADGNVVGSIGLANKPGGFSEDNLRVAGEFGELAEVALASSQLFEAIERSEERFLSVAQTASDAIICTDSHHNVVFWNRGAEIITGFTAEEIVGQPFNKLIPERLREANRQDLAAGAAGTFQPVGSPFERIGLRKDGSEFHYEVSVSKWETREGIFFTTIMRDITRRKQQEEQLAFMATHDPLTGLPNRRALEEAMERIVARARRGQVSALLFLDVDNFKVVNDTLGHIVGDSTLAALAKLLSRQLRGEDMIARLGGDEFAVLLDGADMELARTVAERLLRTVEDFGLTLAGQAFSLGLSIGVVTIDGEQTPSSLLSQADAAMYRAKGQGRNRVVS